MKNLQLCYLTYFFEISYGLRAVLNIHNSVVLKFSFFLNFPLHNTELFHITMWTSSREHQMHVLRHFFDLFDFFTYSIFRTRTISELASSRKWTYTGDVSELPHEELDAHSIPRFWLYLIFVIFLNFSEQKSELHDGTTLYIYFISKRFFRTSYIV